MRPAWSIVIFTTLAGLAQGFFLGLLGIETFAGAAWPAAQLAAAAWGVLALLAAGLVASVFHLGHPERAWRAASQWRTSWLSREVIVLPALMAAVGAHALALTLLAQGALPRAAAPALGLVLGASAACAAALCVALWWCTGMIYACLRMLREWATPLTPLSFGALGLANGLGLAAAWFACALERHAAHVAQALRVGPPLVARVPMLESARASVAGLCVAALAATCVAIAVKGAWCWRREALQPASTLQSALAIAHPQIRQMSMGMTGGSFNTREFFHGAAPWVTSVLPVAMIVFGAAFPLLAFGAAAHIVPGGLGALLLCLVVVLQVAGVLCERWLFFAWARHPQNLYYQRAS
jgi:DMSO reductase anchor subunit